MEPKGGNVSRTYLGGFPGKLLGGLLAGVFMLALAGCGGSGGSSFRPTPTPVASPSAATNSSVFAVDCETNLAYVPLPFLSNNLTGEVGVLDLSVNPDDRDPRTATIDLGLTARPHAAAADMGAGQILVLSDPEISTGVLQIISESDNSITNVSFPTNSRPSVLDGVVYDASSNTALVSMSNVASTCIGNCTGVAVFDLVSQTFGPLLNLDNPLNSFALDGAAGVPLGSSDPITPSLYAPDLTASASCQFSDQNMINLNSDPDGIAVDPTTHLWIAGNFLSSQATVLNLNGATYTSGVGCMLDEAGTVPNSVNQNTGTSENMPGVAINPATHEALLTADSGEQIALLTLPSQPVAQLSPTDIHSVFGSIPNDPEGAQFTAATFPYAVVIDSCHNLGYVLNVDASFLVQIDLDTLKNHPDEISKPLKHGSCAGTSTPFACTNGSGIKYFPLPGVL